MNIAFDVKLFAVVRVDVPDGMDRKAAIALARAAVRAEVDCLDVSREIKSTGPKGEAVRLTLTEVSADGEADLFEIDGEDPESGED